MSFFRLLSYGEFRTANPGLDLQATFSRGYSAYTLVRGPLVDGKQQRLAWEAAERKASMLGGNLATINSAAENQWITSRYAPISFDQWGLWIGLNDKRNNGTWEWSSGERSSYRNWLPAGTPGYRRAEPTNGAGEDYVHIYFNSAAKGRWKDTSVGYRDVALGGGIAEIPVARVIQGKDLNDMLRGGGRADRLIGGKGNDTMSGRGGNDDFLGEAGADVLTGGPGGDHFIYTALLDSPAGENERDRITDFDGIAGDRIDLSEITELQNFSYLQDQPFSAKGDGATEMRFANGLLEADVNGNGLADFAVTLTGVIKFNASWII